MTDQDKQVLRVAMHAVTDAIHPEQGGQAFRVLLPLLKVLKETDLTFQKGLAAVRQVYEHGVEPAVEDGFADRQP